MSTKQKTAPTENPQNVKSEGYVSIYANNTQLQTSAFDVRIIFGEIALDTKIIEQKVSVVMSLHHAKVFAQLLSDNVRSYEQQVGELKLPNVG